MSRLIDRLGNKHLLPVISIINIAIAVVAAALLLWNWVFLTRSNYRLEADCANRYTSRNLGRRPIEAISWAYTYHHVFCFKLFNIFF